MNKEYVFLGRMQQKTRDYIKNLERENRMLEHNWNELKRHLIKEQARIVIENTNEDEFIYTDLLNKIKKLEEGGNNEP